MNVSCMFSYLCFLSLVKYIFLFFSFFVYHCMVDNISVVIKIIKSCLALNYPCSVILVWRILQARSQRGAKGGNAPQS